MMVRTYRLLDVCAAEAGGEVRLARRGRRDGDLFETLFSTVVNGMRRRPMHTTSEQSTILLTSWPMTASLRIAARKVDVILAWLSGGTCIRARLNVETLGSTH